MLRDLVATIPDKGYKRSFFSCPSSISLSSFSSLASLLHVPLIEPDFTCRASRMGTANRLRSPMKRKDKSSMPSSVPSQMESTPSTSSTTSHGRSISSAFHNVCGLPRKTSRLVCVGGNNSCRIPHNTSEACPSMGLGREDVSRWTSSTIIEKGGPIVAGMTQSGAMERSHSESSSGSGTTSNGFSQSSNSYVNSPPSSTSSVLGQGSVAGSINRRKAPSASRNKPTLGGPIIPPAELAKAFEKQATISGPQTTPSSTNYQVSFAASNAAPISVTGGLFPLRHGEEPIPRALSPPPEHFRRRERVLSSSGISVTGSIALGPYTTPSPMNSPPCSPGPDQVRLHDLLSSDSLVAPKMHLYNSAVDSDSGSDDDGDARSVKSDFGAEPHAQKKMRSLSRTLAQWNTTHGTEYGHSSVSTRTDSSSRTNDRQDERNQAMFYPSLRRHSRIRSPGPLIEDDQEPHALRRVFSR